MLNWLNLAKKTARRSTHPKHQLGAVIVRSGRVLSLASNSGSWKAHAEIRALGCCSADPTDATMIVARPKGTMLAKPCKMCEEAIRAAKIKKIVYTTLDGYTVENFKGT